MIIEDYTDLFFNKYGLGYQDIQKINLKSYPPDLSLFLKDDFNFYIKN